MEIDSWIDRKRKGKILQNVARRKGEGIPGKNWHGT